MRESIPDGTASIQIENGEDAATDELPLKLTRIVSLACHRKRCQPTIITKWPTRGVLDWYRGAYRW